MPQQPRVIWLTGLPASGKTTLARAVQAQLSTLGVPVACLDGDELRKGLCADLGLDDASRSENIRRAGEVAKLMHGAGLTVICAFVSPFNADRQRVRQLFRPGEFIECHLSTPLEECMRRDPKGLYERARKGAISGLTGWDAPYETPPAAEFSFNTTQTSVDAMVKGLLAQDEDMAGRDLVALTTISREITSPGKELVDLVPQAQALRDLFERRTNFRIDQDRDIATGQTRLASGLAISPTLAAMCARELFRTLAFIRGLSEAIAEAARPDRPVRVLYAGCGPYALLAVPLMTVFSREQVTFTLMDIHQECLDSALALIDSLGLSQHLDGSVCADATRYRIPADRMPDVIVSETMAVCLRNEPQVSIARNLLSQAPDARMVPQSISVEVALLNWAKELVLLPSDHVGDIPLPERDRIYLGTVFELNAASIRSWEGLKGDRLPAGKVTFPCPLESRYQPHLLTRITVHGNNRLLDYDCSLTVPQRLPGKPVFSGGEILQFHYQTGTYPELVYEVQG